MPYFRNRWQNGALFVVAAMATVLLIWWLNAPVAALLRAAGDVRTWLIGLGPWAPVGYVVFYAAQILIAPLPGAFLAVMAGYLFGFWDGLLLSVLGLIIGACAAVTISRKCGRPLLERFIERTELLRWERRLRLRSPLVWYVFFLFPMPDVVMYAAGLGTISLRWLLPAIILGRATGILIGITMGKATATLPPQLVVIQWALFLFLGFLAYRFQRPLRYVLLTWLRRGRRSLRMLSRSVHLALHPAD